MAETVTHTVQQGEYLGKIAEQYHLTVDELYQANAHVKGVGGPPNYMLHYAVPPFDINGKGKPVVLTIPALPTPAKAVEGDAETDVQPAKLSSSGSSKSGS